MRGGSAVLAAPTFLPQAALSRDRLLARLGNSLTSGKIRVRDGYAVTLGRASARFLSAAPGANARGQTADLLLVANEAQDIQPAIWDAVFDPMAASTNATTLFLGTVWSHDPLLARQMRHLSQLEATDGIQRVWRVPWERVAEDVPVYGERVRQRIAQFGVNHPFIRTEYCLQELEGEGGLFPPERLAAMRGDHPRLTQANPGQRYALLIDVAGEEENGCGPLSFATDNWRDSALRAMPGFGELHESEFRHTQQTTPEGVVQRVASVSHVAVLPGPERAKVLAEVRGVLATQPGVRGREIVEIPYRVDCFWAERD